MATTYGVGYDATIPGIGKCPFDMDRLQRGYVEGSESSPKKIGFGAGFEDGLGAKEVPLLANSCYFESSTSSLRNPGLIKPANAKASDFWGVIADSIITPKLVQKLHQGAIDEIIVNSYMSIGSDEEPKPVQVVTYSSCFIKLVDPISYGFLTLFAFSFAKVTLNQADVQQTSSGGENQIMGQYVYEFDYNANMGSGS